MLPCFIHFTRTHIIPLHLEQVFYERRKHPRFFRLGLTRVLHLNFISVWMGHLNSIPNCHSGTHLHRGSYHLIEDQIFDSRFLKRIRHREKTPTLWTEATSQKSNPCPSQGEKECAACLLMIKLPLKDTCSDCWLAHTCLCAVTITNVSRHLCEEVTFT